jgi:hypothetical protein
MISIFMFFFFITFCISIQFLLFNHYGKLSKYLYLNIKICLNGVSYYALFYFKNALIGAFHSILQNAFTSHLMSLIFS